MEPQLGVKSTMDHSYQLNLRTLFERGCSLQPLSEVVTKLVSGGTERSTYTEIQRRATNIASILTHRYHVNIGDFIGSFMWSHSRHLLLLYAVPCIGAVLNPINFRLHPKDLAFITTHSKHKIMFIDEDLIPLFNAIPSYALTTVQYFIICGINDGKNAKQSALTNLNQHQKVIDFNTFENEMVHKPFIWPALDERNGAYLLYTSGTTGNPKGSLYGHRSIYIHLLNTIATDSYNLSGADCVLSMVQIFHVLSCLLPLAALMLGYKMLLLGRCNDFTQVLDYCLDERCSLIAGVPTVMQAFRHALRSNPEKYNGIRGVLTRAVCGGSAPPADLIRWFWDQWKIEIIQAWGMSETQGVTYISRRCARRSDLLLSEEEKGANSLVPGIPMPSIHGKVVRSEDGGNKMEREMGEFYVNGPIVTSRYYGVDTVGKFDANGWLNTGDIVSYTDKKEIVIHDRSKDMIKSGGEWISSQDMETYIASSFPNRIEKVCVVGVHHALYQERPIVVIQLYDKQNGSVSPKDILKALMAKYANFQLPDDVLFWNEIPCGGTGKISKKDVRLQLKRNEYTLPQIPLRKTINSKL